MSRFTFGFVLLLGLFYPASSYASELITGEIARLYVNYGNVYIRIKSDGCNPNNRYYRFVLTGTNPNENAEAWYAQLLSAAVSSKPVTLAIPDNSCPLTDNQTISYMFQDY